MQIRLTVLGPRSGGQGTDAGAGQGTDAGGGDGPGAAGAGGAGGSVAGCDVLVTAPSGTPLASVTHALVSAAASCGVGPGAVGGAADTVAVYAGAERLDPHRRLLGEPPLLDGAVLSLTGPHEAAVPPSPEGARALLRVVAGPDAGGVHLLRGGDIRIGRSADADVPLDDPDVSRLHCLVTLRESGEVAVADLDSTNGTTIDGRAVTDRPRPLRPGAALRVGESVLRLETGPLGALPHPYNAAPVPRQEPGRQPEPEPGGGMPGSEGPSCPGLVTVPDNEGHLRVVPAGTAFAEVADVTGVAGVTGVTGVPAPETPGAPAEGGASGSAPHTAPAAARRAPASTPPAEDGPGTPPSGHPTVDPSARQSGTGHSSDTGHSSTGYGSTRHGSTGQSNTGQSNAGQSSAGQNSTGHGSAGHSSAGQSSAGQSSAGHSSTGHGSTGHGSPGHGSPGQNSTGQNSTGQNNTRQNSTVGQLGTGQPNAERQHPGSIWSGEVLGGQVGAVGAGSRSSTSSYGSPGGPVPAVPQQGTGPGRSHRAVPAGAGADTEAPAGAGVPGPAPARGGADGPYLSSRGAPSAFRTAVAGPAQAAVVPSSAGYDDQGGAIRDFTARHEVRASPRNAPQSGAQTGTGARPGDAPAGVPHGPGAAHPADAPDRAAPTAAGSTDRYAGHGHPDRPDHPGRSGHPDERGGRPRPPRAATTSGSGTHGGAGAAGTGRAQRPVPQQRSTQGRQPGGTPAEQPEHGRADGPPFPPGGAHGGPPLHPAASDTADTADVPAASDAPAGAAEPRRARGIGAWARRFAGGLSAAGAGAGRTDRAARPRPAGTVPSADPSQEARWPDPATVLLTALRPGPRLWERGPDHPDALAVRLGTAQRADGAVTPVTAGLRECGALGLAGPRPRLAGLARSVVAQLAALHAPGTLEIVVIAADGARHGRDRVAEWSWAGWLPHLRPARGQDCRLLLAFDAEQAAARIDELVRRLDDTPSPAARGGAPGRAGDPVGGPFTLVVIDGDPGTAELRETVSRLAVRGPRSGVHLLCLAETPAATPASPLASTLRAAHAAVPGFASCGTVALLSGAVATAVRVLRRADGTGAGSGAPPAPARVSGPAPSPASPAFSATAPEVATVDAASAAWAERFARALAPLREPAAEGPGAVPEAGTGAMVPGGRLAAALPASCRLLEELGLARATPAALLARWTAGEGSGSGIREAAGRAGAVLGAGPHGPVTADLAAERAHLFLTGGRSSGKTELLRSLAAALAAGDRPDRLGLVLVDGESVVKEGEGLRICGELPHVSTYLAASDPVRMREFAQALTGELKRRAEVLGHRTFEEYARGARRRSDAGGGPGGSPVGGAAGDSAAAAGPDEEPGTLVLRPRRWSGHQGPVSARPGTGTGPGAGPGTAAAPALPRLAVLVDDFDTLVAPALGNPGRPAAGSVVRALEAVARDGARLGIHLIAASGRPDRTAQTAVACEATVRITLGDGSGEGAAPLPGRGVLHRPDGSAIPFQSGRVTGRIPRTSTLRPTVVPLDWARAGDPPARRPVRELGNGPTDLALLASAIERAARSAGAEAVAPLL